MANFAEAAAALTTGRQKLAWQEWTRSARDEYLDFLLPEPMVGDVNLGNIVKHLNDALPTDSIITNGAGNYTLWVQRHYQYKGIRTQLAPTSGTMGYGVPAAIAAKIAYPEKTVVCFAGDGCFLMNGQELATAIQYDLDPIFIVVNNGMYGSIRMHQERYYPRRVHGTDLTNPDFVALAKSYGAYAELVERTDDFAAAFDRAKASGRAALLELRVNQEALSPRLTISSLRT